MSEFFRTHMGHKFYEQTMPALVREIARLNDNIERLIERLPDRPSDSEGQGQSEVEDA